jgi:CTD small phosphatase-like protein 2
MQPIALGTNYLYERYQIENGIPIIPYYDNKNDTELRDLLRFLKKDILPSKDVREVIQKTFQFRRLNEFLTP